LAAASSGRPPRPVAPDERRLVLLVQGDNVDDAEALVAASDYLLARPDHHGVGRLAEIVPRPAYVAGI